MLAGLALLLGSCTKEQVVPGENPGGTADGEGLFAVSLTLDPGTIQSRATTENGVPAERYVNAVRVVLYDGTGSDPVVKYAFDFKIKSFASEPGGAPFFDAPDNTGPGGGKNMYSSASVNQFVTWAQKVDKQDYQVLVIVNPTGTGAGTDADDLLYKTAVGRPLSLLNTAVKLEQAEIGGAGRIAGDKHFTMMNHQGLVAVPASSLRTSEALAHQNPVKVSVERMVAKIEVKMGASLFIPEGAALGTAAQLRWETDRANRWTYWMRKMTYPREDFEGSLETAADYPGDTYAEDPNFSGLTGTSASVGNNFFLVKDTYGTVVDPVFSLETTDTYYALENTLVPNEVAKGNFTRVMIRIPFTPYESEIPLGSSYYVYKNNWITTTEMTGYANNTATIPTTGFDGLAQAIQDAAAAGIDLKSAQTKSFNLYGIRYYHDGISYYSVPLRHFPPEISTGIETYGFYGVVRNNVYRVEINGVNGPGSPTIEEEGYLSADIFVMPWYGTSQNGPIGEKPKTRVTYNYVYNHPDDGEYFWRTDYDLSLQVGQPVPLSAQVLNRYQNAINAEYADYEWGLYGEGKVVEDPISDQVSYNAADNVVKIAYNRIRTLNIAIGIKYHYWMDNTASIYQVIKIPISETGGEQYLLSDYLEWPDENQLVYRDAYELQDPDMYNIVPGDLTPYGQDEITVSAGTEDLYYMHFFERLEASAIPYVENIYVGDIKISGMGEAGAIIKVYLPATATYPDGFEIETSVEGDRTWAVNLPGDYILVSDAVVIVNQQETGKWISSDLEEWVWEP